MNIFVSSSAISCLHFSDCLQITTSFITSVSAVVYQIKLVSQFHGFFACHVQEKPYRIALTYLNFWVGQLLQSYSTEDEYIYIYTHTYLFNGPLSGTTRVSPYQKGKTNLDFTGARDSEWQWHQLGNMQVCTSLQTDNHASTPPLCFYRPDALSAAQPTVSMHWRHNALKAHWGRIYIGVMRVSEPIKVGETSLWLSQTSK